MTHYLGLVNRSHKGREQKMQQKETGSQDLKKKMQVTIRNNDEPTSLAHWTVSPRRAGTTNTTVTTISSVFSTVHSISIYLLLACQCLIVLSNCSKSFTPVCLHISFHPKEFLLQNSALLFLSSLTISLQALHLIK